LVLATTLAAAAAVVAPLIVDRLNPRGGRPSPTQEAFGRPNSAVPSTRHPDSALTELGALLNGRTDALKAKDEKAFLAPFKGAARDVQKRVFRNLVKFSFKLVDYRSGDPLFRPPDGTIPRAAGGILSVYFVHQIKGVDLNPVAERYDWTVERPGTAAPLVVTRVAGGDESGDGYPAYYPMPWDAYPDLSVVRRPHVLVVSAKNGEGTAKRMAPTFERAAKDDLSFWRRNGLGRATTMSGFLIVLEPKRKVFLTMFGTVQDADAATNEIGFAVPIPGFGPRVAYDTSRIAINTGHRRGAAISGTQALLIARHEIAHALVTPLASQTDPAELRVWVAEGFAEYMSMHDRPDYQGYYVRSLRDSKTRKYTLPGNKDFYARDEKIDNSHYVLSMLAIRFIAEEQGIRNALAFVANHYTAPSKYDAQLRFVTGWDQREFARKWSNYVKMQVAK
jgi:hypothetical protein